MVIGVQSEVQEVEHDAAIERRAVLPGVHLLLSMHILSGPFAPSELEAGRTSEH